MEQLGWIFVACWHNNAHSVSPPHLPPASLQYWNVFCQGISLWALGTDVLLSTAYATQAPSKTLLQSSIYLVIPQSCKNIPIRINYSLSLQTVVWLPHIPKISLAHHIQFVMDSCGEISCADLGNSLSWHVYSRFWLHSILYQTIVWLQHHQLYDCHSCQMSHYPMSSQRCVHIYVMRLCGKWCYNPLFIERMVTDNVPEEVWKVGK